MGLEKLWVHNDISSGDIEELCRETGVSELMARVLFNRGVCCRESVEKFLQPSLGFLHSPFLMKGMGEAVERIRRAVERKEKIVVYGDYDVDGVTGVSMLVNFFRGIGVYADYYIPDRIDEGYGLSMAAVEKVLEKCPSLLITVDCGVTAVKEVEFLREKGVDVIVTDHHECKEELPDANAVLNPCRTDCGYPFKELAGAGVAFKLIGALWSKINPGGVCPDFIDLAALGTIADVVPLVDENRIIAKFGIKKIENTDNVGLRALIEAAGLKGKVINVYGIGFVLAPRINAAGRLGDAGRAVRLFTTLDETEAAEIARELNEENKSRQETESSILKEVLEAVKSQEGTEKGKIIVASGKSWHQGVIGIVASRVVEKFHRPCILVSDEDGAGKGSGRSIKGFNLFKALHECGSLLDKYGGHELAAGLALPMENFVAFRERINEYADKVLKDEDLAPKIRIDAYVKGEDISIENAEELDLLAPFGMGNPLPVFAADRLIVKSVRTVGGGKHLKLKLVFEQEALCVDTIGFNMGDCADFINEGDIVEAAFSMEINTWNSLTSVQLNLRDIKLDKEIIKKNNCLLDLDKCIESGGFKEYNEYGGILQAGDITLERSDLAVLYQYIKANCGGDFVIRDLHAFARRVAASFNVNMNYLKLKKGLEIFEELKLISREPTDGHGMRVKMASGFKGKADLEGSSVYRKMQAFKIKFMEEG